MSRHEVVRQWRTGRRSASDEGTLHERVLAVADSHHAAMTEAEDALPLVSVTSGQPAYFADDDTPWDDEGGVTFATLTDASELVIRPVSHESR